jgi:hypothetical protein
VKKAKNEEEDITLQKIPTSENVSSVSKHCYEYMQLARLMHTQEVLVEKSPRRELWKDNLNLYRYLLMYVRRECKTIEAL